MKKNFGGIYICLFDEGTLKVGRATDFNNRFSSHRSAGERFGIKMLRAARFMCVDQQKAESDLIKWCQARCTSQGGREWFKGISFDDCYAIAEEIHAAQIGPHLVADSKSEADSLFERVMAVGRGRLPEAYAVGRKNLLSNEVFAPMVPELDALHLRCERIRLAVQAGGVAPEWFNELNCTSDWESDLFFVDVAKPELSLFYAIDAALAAN